MAGHRVRALLMGGQACVFYGGTEFSRDTDLLILADAANLVRQHDRAYWQPLKAELEQLRHSIRTEGQTDNDHA
jgi:hypothetical protein